MNKQHALAPLEALSYAPVGVKPKQHHGTKRLYGKERTKDPLEQSRSCRQWSPCSLGDSGILYIVPALDDPHAIPGQGQYDCNWRNGGARIPFGRYRQ